MTGSHMQVPMINVATRLVLTTTLSQYIIYVAAIDNTLL